MKFTNILETFRSLGGTADNIKLAYASAGRGLFPENQDRPIKIIVPEKLLVSPEWIFLDKENNLRLKAELRLEAQFVNFYENYQQFFGWGISGLNAGVNYHHALKTLPEPIKKLLLILGWEKSDFNDKSTQDYLNNYMGSRQMKIGAESKLMPILELVNHSQDGIPYGIDQGVTLKGSFKNEIFARYHKALDDFHFLRNYQTVSEANTILSCDVTIKVPKVGILKITRLDNLTDAKYGTASPQIVKNNPEICISFLEIANRKEALAPRKVFITRMQELAISPELSNAIFDGLIEHNIQMREKLIQACKLCLYKTARDIEIIASSQLEYLIHH